MDGPGISLFQGSDLKLSNSFQRAEEEELAEENKRREAELNNIFKDGFDDLNYDDDCSSIASSEFSNNQSEQDLSNHFNFPPIIKFHEAPVYNHQRNLETITEKLNESTDSIMNNNRNIETDISGQHYTHCFKKTTNREEELIDNYKKADEAYDELKVLYEVRMREIEKLRSQIDIEKEAKEEALHQLELTRSDKNQISLELSEFKQLLSKSKDRISELEGSIDKMKLEILNLEKAREEDDEKVKISQEQVLCLERKIDAMERCDASTNRMKQMDTFIDNLNSKHQKELNSLQNKIDHLSDKLEQKDSECKALESKLDEVERKRAALVLEKCDGVSRQENALQALLNQANDEKLELNRQIVRLQTECAGLKEDLDQYERVGKMKLCFPSSSDESGEVGRTGLPSHITKTKSNSNLTKVHLNQHTQSCINNLKDELHRALLGKAAKGNEIKKLQEQVRSKEIQIQEMKERERVYLSQADSLRADITQIVSQLSKDKDNENAFVIQQMKAEIEKLLESNKQHLNTIDQLNNEIIKVKNEMKVSNCEDEVGLRECELAQLKCQTDQLLKAKEMEWRSKLELVIKECDEIKQLYMDLRKNNSKIADQMELQKQQISILIKDKEQVLSLLKEKEILIDKLKEENIKFRVESEISKANPNMNVRDRESVIFLQAEVDRLKTELSELPIKHTEELEGLKNELEAAKRRLMELDKKLRKEFENEMTKIIRERDRLKELIKDYDKCELNKKNNDQVEEIKKLKEEILKLQKNQNIKLDENYDEKIENELKQLETRLVEEHKIELATTEERIKNIMTSYYGKHIEDIKKQFGLEFSKIIENEQKKILELTQLLKTKELEIQKLKDNHSSDKLIILEKKIEEDRLKFSETIKQWSLKVEQLKKKISDDANKILYLNQSLKSERKDAQKYKVKFDNAKKIIQKEKLENMLKIKSDFDNLKVSNDLDGKRMSEKEQIIQMEFSEKENILKQQYEISNAVL